MSCQQRAVHQLARKVGCEEGTSSYCLNSSLVVAHNERLEDDTDLNGDAHSAVW